MVWWYKPFMVRRGSNHLWFTEVVTIYGSRWYCCCMTDGIMPDGIGIVVIRMMRLYEVTMTLSLSRAA